jgi:CBS domain-containing protein
VDRYRARAGGGVWRRTGVQGKRVEAGVGITGHGVSVVLLVSVDCGLYCRQSIEENTMKVSDILRVKGNTLYTTTPDEPLAKAVEVMAEKDIGSLVVMEYGDLVGILTFREVIQTVVKNGGFVGTYSVRAAMDDSPLTCTAETDLDEVRRMMLAQHARYLPVMDHRMLMGVVSFYDVARAVVDAQNFENKMLKAYIRDWPEPSGNA